MKLLHIITSLRSGGAEKMVAELLPRLRDRGHHVELLLFDGTRTPLLEAVGQSGIKVHVLGRGALQMWNPLHVLPLRKYLNDRRFDIVHTHNTSCQLLTAAAAGKNAPVLVTTEHNTFNRRRNWRWYDAVDRKMYGRYAHIVCVGERTAQNLVQSLGSVPAGLSVVPNGVDIERFAGAAPDFSLLEEADKGRRIVLMVAAFREQKDQPTLLRAMLHLPDSYRLWLVGDWVLLPSCKRLAAELGISDRVRFWGSRSDVPSIMAMSDVVVLSSHYEGMSLASIEGMASGKPFIASDVEGLHDIVGGAGLLFPHRDDRSLAELIRRVCEDAGFAGEVVERCRLRASQYGIETVVQRHERIYDELLRKKQMK